MASNTEQRAVLRDEIVALVNEYGHSTAKLPFSDNELVGMAILSSDDDPVDKERIRLWIYEKFTHYQDSSMLKDPRYSEDVESTIGHIESVYSSSIVPLCDGRKA